MQAHYKDEIARYEKEKGEIQTEAKSLESEYEQLNVHDDQFDMSEACLSVGLGVFLGLGGFLGWSFHPDWLAKFLG